MIPHWAQASLGTALTQKLCGDAGSLASGFADVLSGMPSTVAQNAQEMQVAGIPLTEVWAMCTQHRTLLRQLDF